MPTSGSYRGTRDSPLSMTTRNFLDGQRGFGDRCRQHYLAPPRRRGRDRAILLTCVERAVEGDDIDGVVTNAFLQQRLGAADFTGAWQKYQE